MSNRDMKVSVLVQLVDRLTSPLRNLTRGISSVANRVGELGRRIGVVGAALASISFMAPLNQAAAWDAQMRDIAITAGKTGAAVEEMIKSTSVRYEKLALEVGQRSEELAKGAQLLIAAGMNSGLIDKLMPTIGRVATAANATIEDTAKTAFALSETLKIAPEQMEMAMAKLVTAGKLGRFEFKNMASEFPGLTAQMAKFGITGMEAVNFLGASLQTAMLGTDSPSEAANNLKNFLTKINAPEAIKKFEKELKVDVVGVMTDATAKGINPVEAVIQKMTEKMKVPAAEIDKIMKKAGQSGLSDKDREAHVRKGIEQLIQGTKVGKLYADMQVLDFLIPMLLNTAKYKKMKDEIAKAGIDVIADDFASRMRGLSAQMMMFGEVGTQAMRRIGLAFASNLPMANRALTSLLQWVAQVDAKWPGLIDTILTGVGALLALGVAIAILTPVVSALATPFGAVILAIAALGAVIYRNWDTIGPHFARALEGLQQSARGFVNLFTGLFTGDLARARDGAADVMSGLVTIISSYFDIYLGIVRGAALDLDKALGTDMVGSYDRFRAQSIADLEAVTSAMQSHRQASIADLEALKSKMSELFNWMSQTAVSDVAAQFWKIGSDAIQGLWDGMKAKFDELISWASGLPARLVAAIGSIDLSNIIKLPAWLGGTGGKPGPVDGGSDTMSGSAPPAGGAGIGGSNGFARTSAANSNVQVGGKIIVEAAEGSRVVNVQSENPAVPVVPNRGTMVGRP